MLAIAADQAMQGLLASSPASRLSQIAWRFPACATFAPSLALKTPHPALQCLLHKASNPPGNFLRDHAQHLAHFPQETPSKPRTILQKQNNYMFLNKK
ncbi:hypothetical protein [Pseudomonas batumici]|uniref:hypothetical protein n=1 Tax=Pseudomonas batumici TaxID=226910 RepID=UPI0012EE74EB|nr:hypothetical protein [Pseudomonas batumici]